MHESLPKTGTAISLILGFTAIIKPGVIGNFVSIKPIGKEGISEIQATYDGFFVGISSYALYSNNNLSFNLIGFGWLMAAFVRLVSVISGKATPKNLAAIAFESFIGLMCISKLLIN